ncbi:xylose isomerase-like protein [Aspergillus karnatakaensis]|uniref:sugar phosphate isomerase/epimerase family protein n=1 Tax=Aspergillus karnatakaensis TaxID=1810916 RepID=UPI003CCDAA53
MSSKSEASKIPLSYATVSLGPPSNPTSIPLPEKLSALSSAGFNGIELGFPDLLSFASSFHNRPINPSDYPSLISAATEIKSLCARHGLSILMLQPFSNFEGWPRGSAERDDAFSRARGWISIMDAAGIGMVQVGSSDTPLDKLSSSGRDLESLRRDIITDLREFADLLDEKGMRMAYENWCWSSHATGWKDVWSIVKEVDRENVGLCLDTFQSAGGKYGDPTTRSGTIGDVEAGSEGEKALRERFERSMAGLAESVPREKIYLLQISDAYRPVSSSGSSEPKPLESGVVDGTAPRGRWSHDFRPMPYNGGYLPIESVGRAVLRTGFRGWFSVEIFDGGVDGEGREGDLREFAGRARERVGSFIENCLRDQ